MAKPYQQPCADCGKPVRVPPWPINKEDIRCLSCGLDKIEEEWRLKEKSATLMRIEKVECPLCHKSTIIGFDEKLTNHNIGWLPPDSAGVSYPIRCLGSLKPYQRPPIPKECLN